MKCIEIAKVVVLPNRQRRLFDAAKLHEFADGVLRRGLLHPIILREHEGELTLVAGERRLRAISDLAMLGQSIKHDGEEVPLGSIPYTLLSDLDPLAAAEAELEENTHRENLTWQERAAAFSRLNDLRTAQATARGDPPPTVAAIAEEVRGSSEGSLQETTRRELILAKHLDKPEVKAAKSVDEAWKLLKRAEDSRRNADLAERVGRTFSANMHEIILGDSLEWLASAPEGAFDCILTDPPYGMGADEFGDSGGLAAGAHGYADDEEYFAEILQVCEETLFRIAKPQAHLYWFCDIDKFWLSREAFTRAGWSVFRTPFIWYKKSNMRAPWPHEGPQRKYETILYAVKGKRNVLRMGGDVLDFPPDSNLGHSAQKPVALFQELLSRSCRPGDTVLDPFMGTGTVLAAAHELKVRATGVERDAASYGIAVKRLEELKAQLELGL